MSRVFVTGATGFVGRAVVQALRAHGHSVRCLVRRGSERDLRGLGAIERVEGDVLVRQGLEEGMAGCQAVIHLVGIIREQPSRGITFEQVHTQGTINVIDAAAAAGVRRFLHMSALGTRPNARSRYHRTKWAAEEAVRASGLRWTIFRPSIIYGRGDQFVTMLAYFVGRYPVMPVIGSGRQRLQPVPVEHVAEGFARGVVTGDAEKQTYEVGGPDTVT
ncbi:MAG: complex I NDUFA9 subunit family protein, partial [Candidatus Limnocylindria bacterium]